MTHSDRRRVFLQSVAATSAAVGLSKLMPSALAACPPSQLCPPETPGFLLQRTGVSYATLQQAATAAQSGDTIFVTPAVYLGNKNCAGIAVNLTIKSAIPGQKWRIDTSLERTATGRVNFQGFQQKGLIVKQAGCTQLVVEDCEFIAEPVNDDFFAGLYTEGNNWHITARNCYFRGCDNGILVNNAIKTNPTDTSSITLERCIFEACGEGGGGTHNIYIGDIASLTMTGCYSARCDSGHLLKTRAKQTTLTACRFTGEGGTESFSADFSNGGDVLIVGCIFEQGVKTENPVLITYGRELQFWGQWPDNRIHRFRMYQSSVVNDLGFGTPLELFVTPATKDIQDNIWAGAGSPSFPNNSIVAVSNFEDAATQDYRLNAPIAGSRNWAQLEYVHPASVKPRTDSDRGAVSNVPLPFWATPRRLPSGTWYEISESNRVMDLHQSGPMWPNYNNTPDNIIGQWSGGDFSADYSMFGGYVVTGNGHAGSAVNHLNNSVCVWNADTAQWEFGVPAWYDASKVVPGPGATLKWRAGDPGVSWYVPGNAAASQQTDPNLAARGEYVAGVPAASHTYGNCCVIPASCGGSPKGSLIVCAMAFLGVGNSGAVNWWSHEANLATGRWGRYGLNAVVAGTSTIGTNCLDWRRKKIYYLGNQATLMGARCGIVVIDCVTKQHSLCAIPWQRMNNDKVNGFGAGMAFIPHATDPNLDIVVIYNNKVLSVAWAKDLAALDGSLGFWNGNHNQACPMGEAYFCGFTYVPEMKAIYLLDRGDPNKARVPAQLTLWKLTPPQDRRNGTWTWSSEALKRTDGAGNVVEAQNPNDWQVNGTYNRFMYAPKAKAFLLCDKENMKMRAFRPTGLI